MPELPEVETIARGVHARVRSDRILEAWFGSHREPLKTSAARQARGLESRTILAVRRSGKHIVFDLSAARDGALDESPGTAVKQAAEKLDISGKIAAQPFSGAKAR